MLSVAAKRPAWVQQQGCSAGLLARPPVPVALALHGAAVLLLLLLLHFHNYRYSRTDVDVEVQPYTSRWDVAPGCWTFCRFLLILITQTLYAYNSKLKNEPSLVRTALVQRRGPSGNNFNVVLLILISRGARLP